LASAGAVLCVSCLQSRIAGGGEKHVWKSDTRETESGPISSQ
jgi:hypothetical protein